MQRDHLVHMPGALIQHGPASDRVYLMKLTTTKTGPIIATMEALARANGYSKLVAKVPRPAAECFRARGFHEEALVPGMYAGTQDGCFMASYRNPQRAVLHDAQTITDILRTARETAGHPSKSVPPGLGIRSLGPDDAQDMAQTYREIFETYPFPIHDPAYLRATMDDHVHYFGIQDASGRLLALSSAEVDPKSSNAEMTDFATRIEFQGKGLAALLLTHMDTEMHKTGIRTAYTIARAHATGINVIFARKGYTFAGTLPNNTQIKGSLESMNVWFKNLANRHNTRTV